MYAQQDPAWAGNQLGYGPDTIGSSGCYLTSDADLLQWIGHDITPAQLNDLYVSNGIYVDGELLMDSALADAFPDLWRLEEVYHCESFPCDQAKLDNDDPNLFVVVEILGPNGLTHFAPVIDWRTWTIADTWDGAVRTIGERGSGWGWGSDNAALVGKVMRYRFLGGSAATPAQAAPGTFTGVVDADGGAWTHFDASTSAASRKRLLDKGTALTIDRYSHAETVADVVLGTPDDRWFHLADGSDEWIASAVVNGNPGPDVPVVQPPEPQVPAPAPAPLPVLPPTPQPLDGPATMPSIRCPFAVWIASPNITADRRDRVGSPTDVNAPTTGPSHDLRGGWDLVFHSEDGSEAGTDSTFQDASGAGPRSAHFSVALDGSVRQFVDLKDAAWHAGVFEINRRSVGIEHEDGGDPVHVARSLEQLRSSAGLVAWLVKTLGRPPDQYLRHRDIVATACPGNLPVEAILTRAQVPLPPGSGPFPPPPTPGPPPAPTTNPARPPLPPPGPSGPRSLWQLLLALWRRLFVP